MAGRTHGVTSRDPSGVCLHLPIQERPHELGDHLTILFEREVPGIQDVKLEILEIAFVRIRSLGREDRIVLAPHDQGRGLMLAEVRLPRRVERRITPVVVEELAAGVNAMSLTYRRCELFLVVTA